MPDPHFIFILFIVGIALIFDFYNGMNDAANSIATVVSTKVLTPKLAVAWAAFFNFVAAFGFGVKVATTIGKGVIDPLIVNEYLILSALIGAILWTAIATHIGMPISVSHSLVGGMIGAAIAKTGTSAIITTGLNKILLFILLSPFLGFILGVTFMVITLWIVHRQAPSKVDKHFRILQLFSAAGYSLGHGTNDAQKTMGIIAVLLFSSGYLGQNFHVPFWLVLLCHFFIAMGTMIGGWRVIKTLGLNVTKLKPIGGFCAETASAFTLLFTALAGIPVSTTHTITGAIIGVGSTVRLSAIRWGIARNIIMAWIFTIPFTALAAWIVYYILKFTLSLS
ncbi:MAG TPA: inorganic phosphate transporter [bacterium]